MACCLATPGRVVAGEAAGREAEPPTAVAVLHFANQTQGPAGEAWDWLEQGLADLLIADLSHHPRLELVGREQMQAAVVRLRQAGGVVPEWQQVVARQLAVSRAVFGSYRVAGETLTVHATLFDPAAQAPAAPLRVEVEGAAEDVLTLQKQLAGKLVDALFNDGEGVAFAQRLPVWTESASSARLVYEGVGHFDAGEYDEAWLRFRRALRQDPGYADARYWIGRTYFYQLRYDHAQLDLADFVERYPTHPRTADAVRELVDCLLLTHDPSRPETVVRLLTDLRASAGEQWVYEPHGWAVWAAQSYRRDLMPIRAWLGLRLAEAKRHAGDRWGAWEAYRKTFETLEQAMPAGREREGMLTLDTVTSIWEKVPVDGRRILATHPRYAYEVRADRNTYTLEQTRPAMQPHDLVGALPWFVPAEGKLIAGVTVEAVFAAADDPANDPEARVMLSTRQPRVPLVNDRPMQWLFLDAAGNADESIIARTQEAKPTADDDAAEVKRTVSERQYAFARGVRSLRFNVDYLSPATQRLRFTFDLVDERDTAAVVVDALPSDVRLHMVPHPDAIKLRDFFHADLYPHDGYGGWLPGSHKLHWRGVADHAATTVDLEPGDVSRPRLAWRDNFPQPGFRRMIADGGSYPDFLLAGRFERGFFNPIARPVDDGPRRHAIPLENYYEITVQLVPGPAGRLHAFWNHRQDLWQAVSEDGGQTWSDQQRLPVPVNSAHREYHPQVIRDQHGRYVLLFVSDRDAFRQLSPYIATSRDLKHWTRPRRIGDGPAAYAFLYQDAQQRFVLLQDGRRRLWQRTSDDLVDWSAPEPVVTAEQGVAMFRPRVVRTADGRYHLLAIWCQPMAGQRTPMWLVAGESVDGVSWSNWRVLSEPGDEVRQVYAVPSGRELLVLTEQAVYRRDAAGRWSHGSVGGLAWTAVPGGAAEGVRLADGRVLAGAGVGEVDHVVRVDFTQLEAHVREGELPGWGMLKMQPVPARPAWDAKLR
ncbi:MAG: hypothetical protein WDZ31_10705 [Phycisphaeraceae bacterium]